MNDRIAVIGIGRLGLCFALAAAKAGFKVMGVDNRPEHVAAIKNRTLRSNEPGVNELLADNIPFEVTTDLEEAVIRSDVSFIFVPTPSQEDGSYDHSAIDDVLERLPFVGETRELVIACTTMPGYVSSRIGRAKEHGFRLSYSPEFIAQGDVLHGLTHPDVILIGQADVWAGDKIHQVYARLCPDHPDVYRMTPTAAEIAKIALNCFLTLKISFANAVGDLLTRYHCRDEIALALNCIGADRRIGPQFLGYGYGYGGPCLPRDNRALAYAAQKVGMDLELCMAADAQNRAHLEEQLDTMSDWSDAIVFDGVAYKRGTDIIEESQALALAVAASERFDRRIIIRDTAEVIDAVRALHGDRFEYEVVP